MAVATDKPKITTFTMHTYSIKWKVDWDELSDVMYLSQPRYSSIFLQDIGQDKFQWQLELNATPHKEVNKVIKYLSLYLHCVDTECKTIQPNVLIQNLFFEKSGEMVCDKKFGYYSHQIKRGDKMGDPCFISFDGINLCSLTDYQLNLGCDITVMYELSSSREEYSITQDHEKLLRNKKLTDFVIKVKEREFHAHKCMLASRSEVFEAMFEHDTVENRTNRVEISDVAPEAMIEFLHFVYTDLPPTNLRIWAADLLHLADKYNVKQLKLLAESELISSISLENVCDTMSLSYLHACDDLKNSVLDFFIGHFEILIKNEEFIGFFIHHFLDAIKEQWKEISRKHPDKANEIMWLMREKLKKRSANK